MLAHYFPDRFGKAGAGPVNLAARSGRAAPGGRLMPFAAAVLRLYRSWTSRARDRRELARMSDRELRDISLTRSDVEFLVNQPFWKP
nr:DUF1127 domain-containing protein [uncultured Rhodopila sp.]